MGNEEKHGYTADLRGRFLEADGRNGRLMLWCYGQHNVAGGEKRIQRVRVLPVLAPTVIRFIAVSEAYVYTCTVFR